MARPTTKTATAVALGLAALITGCSLPAPEMAWRPVGAPFVQPPTPAEIAVLAEGYPDSGQMAARALADAIAAGDRPAALRLAKRLMQMGGTLAEPDRLAALERLIAKADGGAGNDPADAALVDGLTANATPIAASTPWRHIPGDHRLVEGVMWDAATETLYATTIVSRALLRQTGGDARWTVVPGLDAGSLSGLAIDPARRRLWVASAVYEQTPDPSTAFRGLIALDLDSGAVVARVAAPADATPSDLAVAADGTVYASDPLLGRIYRLAPGSDRLVDLIAPRILRSPQGIAVSRDGALLYVSDIRYGIAIVDRASGAVSRLVPAAPTMLDGVDGLIRRGDELIAIQSGSVPRRIAAFRLSDDGRRVTGTRVIERAHPDWEEPTLGTLVDDDLVYVANAGWDLFLPGGAPNPDVPRPAYAPRTELRRVALVPGRPPAH